MVITKGAKQVAKIAEVLMNGLAKLDPNNGYELAEHGILKFRTKDNAKLADFDKAREIAEEIEKRLGWTITVWLH